MGGPSAVPLVTPSPRARPTDSLAFSRGLRRVRRDGTRRPYGSVSPPFSSPSSLCCCHLSLPSVPARIARPAPGLDRSAPRRGPGAPHLPISIRPPQVLELQAGRRDQRCSQAGLRQGQMDDPSREREGPAAGRIIFEFGEDAYYGKGGAQLFPISSEDRKKEALNDVQLEQLVRYKGELPGWECGQALGWVAGGSVGSLLTWRCQGLATGAPAVKPKAGGGGGSPDGLPSSAVPPWGAFWPRRSLPSCPCPLRSHRGAFG